MKSVFTLIAATALVATPSFAASRFVFAPGDSGAYTSKVDDGLWAPVRDVAFDVTERSNVIVHTGVTVDGASSAIGGSNVVSGIVRINIVGAAGGGFSHDVFEFTFGIAGNAGGSYRAPVLGNSTATLAPGSYIAKVAIWSPRAGANTYRYKYKALKTTVEITPAL